MIKFTMAAAMAASLLLTGTSAAYAADPMLVGIVNANGTKQTNGPFTVSHPSTGRYILTMTNYTGGAVCLFNAIGAGTFVAGAGFSSKTCDVTFANKKGKAADVLFTFYAANPS